MQTIQAIIEPTETKEYFEVNEFPEECPLCKKGGQFKVISASWRDGRFGDVEAEMQVVFKCPREKCASYFMALYENRFRRQSSVLSLWRSALVMYEDPVKFSEIINVISPKFSIIYNQAKIAEDNKLDQICGAGYRKALEFLIKDYLTHLDPSSEKEIKETKLGTLIDKINDRNIQIVAKRAAWLGNDEAHYERIWETKDVKNLKDLIELTVSHIQTSEKTKQYEEEMPEKK